MEQQTLEGTWEEILQYSTQLAGQRVKLIILPNQLSNSPTKLTLDQRLKGWLAQQELWNYIAVDRLLLRNSAHKQTGNPKGN